MQAKVKRYKEFEGTLANEEVISTRWEEMQAKVKRYKELEGTLSTLLAEKIRASKNLEEMKANFAHLARNIGTSAASNWEADDLGNEDLSLDTLEKRVTRLAHGK